MRQIKFRGKAKTGEWIDGGLVYSEQEDTYYIGVTELLHPVLPETVGQFTGLKDCAGYDIYEGDILFFPEANQWVDVVFDDGSFSVLFEEDDEPTTLTEKLLQANFDVVVSSNIHEAPELVQGEGGEG